MCAINNSILRRSVTYRPSAILAFATVIIEYCSKCVNYV